MMHIMLTRTFHRNRVFLCYPGLFVFFKPIGHDVIFLSIAMPIKMFSIRWNPFLVFYQCNSAVLCDQNKMSILKPNDYVPTT